MYLIYLIRNQITDKIHIGQTKQGKPKRMKQHIYDSGRGRRFLLETSMRKWGAKYFTICTLVDGIKSWKEANRLESLWIRLLDSNNRQIGYNMTAGGEGIRDPDGAVRKKLSEATKKHQEGNPKKNPAYRHDVPTEELLRLRYQGVSVEEMARKYEVSSSLIYRRFKKLGVPLIPNLLNQDEEIYNLYVVEKYTTTEIATAIKASVAKIHDSLVRQKVTMRPPGSRPRLADKREKKCPGCGIIKSMDKYHNNSRNLDKRSTRCIECDNKDSAKYKANLRAKKATGQ
jgi:GIY-YIG catalytic domain